MIIEIRKIKNDTKGVFARRAIPSEYPIYWFKPTYIPESTRTSIQFEDKHFEDDIGKYLNHNCDPNSKISKLDGTKYIVLFATTDIKKDEELTFDYNTTEKELSHPFKCNCHNKLIIGYE